MSPRKSNGEIFAGILYRQTVLLNGIPFGRSVDETWNRLREKRRALFSILSKIILNFILTHFVTHVNLREM